MNANKQHLNIINNKIIKLINERKATQDDKRLLELNNILTKLYDIKYNLILIINN